MGEKVTNKVWARKQRRRRKVQTDPVHTCLLTRGHKWRRRTKHDRPEKLKQKDRKHEKKPKKRSAGKKMKDGNSKKKNSILDKRERLLKKQERCQLERQLFSR